jgi:hypothetical protein
MCSSFLQLFLLAVVQVAASNRTAEVAWKEKVELAHEEMAEQGTCVWREAESKPKPGFLPEKLSKQDRERLGYTDQRLFVSKKPVLEIRRIRGAHLRWPSQANPMGEDLMIEWYPEGRKLVRDATQSLVGRKIAIYVNGKLLLIHKVMEVIDADAIQVASTYHLSSFEAIALLRALNPPVDEPAAEKLSQHCRQGHTPTCLLLGKEAMRGRDMDFDPRLAFDSLRAACEQIGGQPCAEAHVLTYTYGIALAADESAELSEKACAANHLESCDVLGQQRLLDHRSPESQSKARAAFTKACEGGYGESCLKLAKLVRKEEGPAAEKQIVAFLERACSGGSDRGCIDLGERALSGVPSDREVALKWFAKACALDPLQESDALSCKPTPDQEKRIELMRAAGCRVRPPKRCAPQ